MYENKKRSKMVCGYVTDITITIIAILLLSLLVTMLAYKEIIEIKYLKYLITAILLLGGYITAAVTKAIFDEEAVKYVVTTAVVLGMVILICGITKQREGGDIKTAVINISALVTGRIIPNVIKTTHKKKRRHR